MSDIHDDVAALNMDLGFGGEAEEPAAPAEEKKAEKTPDRPPQDTEDFVATIQIVDGWPVLPSSMLRVEVGRYQTVYPQEDGFEQIGFARVYEGIPVPLGNGQVEFRFWGWEDHQVQVLGTLDDLKAIKIVGPNRSIGAKDRRKTYPTAAINYQERLSKAVEKIIRNKQMRTAQDIWEEADRSYKYSYERKVRTPVAQQAKSFED